jgi:hypothetical protein
MNTATVWPARPLSATPGYAAIGLALLLAAVTQSNATAQEGNGMTPTAPATTAGPITAVTRNGAALTQPGDAVEGQVTRYGLGFIFQVGPNTAAVSCNIRTAGVGHWDYENGSDVVVFDDVATLSQQKPVVCARNETDTNPANGKKRVTVNYPIVVGFVPLGAKRADGSAIPGAGSGFGFSQALCFDLNEQGYFTWDQPSTPRWFLHQFAYDGKSFRITAAQMLPADAPLKIGDGQWAVTDPGLSCAVPDGDDLLFAVVAKDSVRQVAGVTRWRRDGPAWRPVIFYGITGGSEPSLIRDADGSLLYSIRGAGEEGKAVRVWRSRDGGENWQQVLHIPDLRSNAPVALDQSANGTPYIAANHPASFRATVCLWPLNPERTGVGAPIIARDSVAEFGPAPEGTTWFADHPTATTVRLADGQWHNLLAYRVMAFGTTGVGGEILTPRTGCYIQDVSAPGPVLVPWRF